MTDQSLILNEREFQEFVSYIKPEELELTIVSHRYDLIDRPLMRKLWENNR